MENKDKNQRQLIPKIEKEKAKIAKLHLEVALLKQSPAKELLKNQLTEVDASLQEGNWEYSKQYRRGIHSLIRGLRLKQIFGEGNENKNIGFLLLGIVCYAVVVFFIGVCAVIIYVYQNDPQNELIGFIKTIGILPLFAAVSSLGITVEAYLWGIIGGAGAVANMVRRFDRMAARKSSFWPLFTQGLFGPIAGSLSAVVAVAFIDGGLLDIFKPIPPLIVAFFAGFSEQLIDKLGERINPKSLPKTE